MTETGSGTESALAVLGGGDFLEGGDFLGGGDCLDDGDFWGGGKWALGGGDFFSGGGLAVPRSRRLVESKSLLLTPAKATGGCTRPIRSRSELNVRLMRFMVGLPGAWRRLQGCSSKCAASKPRWYEAELAAMMADVVPVEAAAASGSAELA